MSSAAVAPLWLDWNHSQHLCAVRLSTVPFFLSLLVFSLTFFFLTCASSLSLSPSLPLSFFLFLSHCLQLVLSLWADSPSALILLCTVLLQMRQARRLSNPCIQRYTSRIGECSSTYVSSSKSPPPPFKLLSLPFLILISTHWLALGGCRHKSRSDLTPHLILFYFFSKNKPHPKYGCDNPTSAPPFTPSSSLLLSSSSPPFSQAQLKV